jgi:dTDP-4-dehydrorhamnose 3,5-epimerase
MMEQIEGVELTPLKQFIGNKGNVYHGLKKTDSSFSDFGEAYFSTVENGAVKGWKKHTIMVSNLIVPLGAVRFVLYDDRPDSLTRGHIMDVTLSLDNYMRLTIPVNIWMAFQGVGKSTNMLLNISSITHNPQECLNREIGDSQIPFNQW